MATPEENFPALWRRAIDALDGAGVTAQQRAFVRLARPVGLLDGTALLAAPNDLTKEILEQRVRENIVAVLSDQLGYPVRLAVTVDPGLIATEPAQEQSSLALDDEDDDVIDVRLDRIPTVNAIDARTADPRPRHPLHRHPLHRHLGRGRPAQGVPDR